jgi:enamine deaminase RidA (YjgF/YER057c/UK114 family)
MKRRSINVPGFAHGDQPVPAAARVGNMVVTGGIWGLDPATGRVPDDPDAQCELMFANLARVLLAGGAGMDDIVRLTIYTRSGIAKDVINRQWRQAFPDEERRPARHIIINDHLLGNTLMLCEAIAYTT